MADSNFFFRDDMQADKDREAAGVATLAPAPAAPITPAAPTAPAAPAASPFKALATAANATQEKPDYFADFRKSLDAQDPFKQKLQGEVDKTIANPYQGFDAGAAAQTDKLGREIGAEQERVRQEAILKSGGQPGAQEKALGAFGNKAIMAQAELGRDLSAGRAQAGEAARSNAINQGLGLLGESRAGATDAANIGLAQSGQKIQQEEGAASRATQEKVAYAQIGSSEKMQGAALAHETSQKALDRSLEQLLQNDRIGAQFKLADMDQVFQQKMQANGFINDKELETMRDDLQKTLQERGITADVAKQIADQKFTTMMAEKDQNFQVQMNDIKQKFVSGERVDAQTWEAAMKAGDMQHDELMAKLQSTLRLDEAGNAQAFQTSFQQLQNEFTVQRDQAGYNHEDSMRIATEAFQQKLEAQGYTHEEAMQGAQLAAAAFQGQQNRASQELMAAAQLSQQDSQFSQEIQQKYSFNADDIALRTKELEGHLSLMGLQGDQLKGAIADSKVNSAMQIAALGMEIGNGSAEALAPFVEQFGAALSTYFKAQGIDISSSEFAKSMMTGAKTTAGTTGTTGAATADTVKPYTKEALDASLSAYGDFTNLPAKLKYTDVSATVKALANHAEDNEAMALLSTSGKMKLPGDWSKATPVQRNAASLIKLTTMGLTEQQAAQLMIPVLGNTDFTAAYKALTGKDWKAA